MPPPAFSADCFALRSGASALTSSKSFTNGIQYRVADARSRFYWQLGTGNWQLIYVGKLIAETRCYGNTLAPFGPAARQHGSPVLRLHASPEPVLLRALALIGLKCTFRHRKSLLLIKSDG